MYNNTNVHDHINNKSPEHRVVVSSKPFIATEVEQSLKAMGLKS